MNYRRFYTINFFLSRLTPSCHHPGVLARIQTLSAPPAILHRLHEFDAALREEEGTGIFKRIMN
jgi:hypothetical protein